MSSAFFVPDGISRVELEIKKSRFIGLAARVDNKADVQKVLEAEKQRYPDARHHCWAYQIGSPASPRKAAMNDDGEPSGTAGKPILNVLQHKDIGHIMVVVTRYFGGIKLGAGGLVRAYSAAAEQAVSELALTHFEVTREASISCDFSQEQYVRHWLGEQGISVQDCQYSHVVTIQFNAPERIAGALEDLSQRPEFEVKVEN